MPDAALALPQIGEIVGGKYRITRRVGEGGMGVVFAAEHEILGQEVALKVLGEAMATPEAVKRFLNEGRAAARIQGEHVARVHDLGMLEGGRPFICMELLAGEDLAQRLARAGPLSPELLADYLLEALEALAQAHALGIVHRDLKPSNLFLATRPDGGHVLKVLDFGIAKAVGGDPRWQSNTTTKCMVGSPLYMAPEQIRRSKTADPQSDIWAVGAMAYELLCGAPPFQAEELGELFLAIVENTPEPVESRRPGIPPALGAVVARCLEKDREKRFRLVVELAAALKPFASALGANNADRIAATMSRVGTRSGANSAPAIVVAPAATPSVLEAPVATPAIVKAPQTPVEPQAHARTKQTWATGADGPAPQSRRLVPMAAAAALVASASIAGVLVLRGHVPAASEGAPRSASPSASEASVAPYAMEPVAPVESAALAPLPDSAPSDSAAPSAQTSRVGPGPVLPRPPRARPAVPAPGKSAAPTITQKRDLF